MIMVVMTTIVHDNDDDDYVISAEQMFVSFVANPVEKQLLDNLFSSYDARVRPTKSNNSVLVTVQYWMVSLLDLVSKEEVGSSASRHIESCSLTDIIISYDLISMQWMFYGINWVPKLASQDVI